MISRPWGGNEKIEGFYEVWQRRGFTGTQGVLIPHANVRHRMLRPDGVAAIRAGQCHVYPLTHVDQGLTLLTGVPAGDVATPGTIHFLVKTRLQHLAHAMATFGDGSHNGTRVSMDEGSATRE